MVKQLTPLWATSATVIWSIHQDSLPRCSSDLVKVQSLRMTLCDWVEQNSRMFGESPYWFLARPEQILTTENCV